MKQTILLIFITLFSLLQFRPVLIVVKDFIEHRFFHEKHFAENHHHLPHHVHKQLAELNKEEGANNNSSAEFPILKSYEDLAQMNTVFPGLPAAPYICLFFVLEFITWRRLLKGFQLVGTPPPK